MSRVSKEFCYAEGTLQKMCLRKGKKKKMERKKEETKGGINIIGDTKVRGGGGVAPYNQCRTHAGAWAESQEKERQRATPEH